MFIPPKIHSGSIAVDQAWEKLCRWLQTKVEHERVWNDEATALVRGEVLYLTAGDRRAHRALADAGGAGVTAEWVGVSAEPSAAGTQVVMRDSGYALVRFEDGLDLVEGTPCFVSDTVAGAATNEEPLSPAFSSRIGIIGNAQGYVTVTNHFAWVFLGKCCAPQEVPIG